MNPKALLLLVGAGAGLYWLFKDQLHFRFGDSEDATTDTPTTQPLEPANPTPEIRAMLLNQAKDNAFFVREGDTLKGDWYHWAFYFPREVAVKAGVAHPEGNIDVDTFLNSLAGLERR